MAIFEVCLGLIEGGDEIRGPGERVPGGLVGSGDVERVHKPGEVGQVLQECFVEAAPCIYLADSLQLVNSGDSKRGNDVVGGRDFAMLKFDTVDFCGLRKDAYFAG